VGAKAEAAMKGARTVLLSCVASTAMVFVAPPASAQDSADAALALHTRHRTFESPQHFALEFRFAPYTPAIDSDPALHGATPYKDIFGTMPRLLFAAEFDWQVVRIPHVGTLGPGLAIGYTSMGTKAPLSNGTGLSGEDTSLDIYPMYAVAVFRADVFWKELHIPLVPYAKAGVGLAFWRASNTLGTSSYGGVVGKGHSFGTHLAIGAALSLNAFDQYTAKNFDNSMGVNNTSLFIEYMRSDLNGILQDSALRVGSDTWVAGLALEF
jgi:hypothetical protein